MPVTSGSSERTATAAPLAHRGHPAWWLAIGRGLPIIAAVFAVAAAASVIRVPSLAIVITAVAIAGGITVAAVLLTRTGLAAAWISACGACGAGWLVYAVVTRPWAYPAVIALIIPAAALISLWPPLRAHEARLAEAERRRLAEAAAAAESRRWPELLSRIGYQGIQFIERGDTLCGYRVRLHLPRSGRVTYTQLAGSRERLEVAARMRHGSLRFERGASGAHEVILHVSERDVLAETIPLPVEARSLTINRPIPIGVYEDGTVCALTLREVATLIVGLRGQGKSNLLNVLIAQLARCVDVLPWAIDLKGGRMAGPWLAPWLAHRTPNPVLDWVATTREEAEIMIRAGLRAIEARSKSGSGGEKIIPSEHQPAILLIVDEAAVILGYGMGGPRTSLQGTTNTTLAGLMTQLTVTGRSEAIDPILATQRGSVTMTGSGDLKSQCGLRIGLGVATEADAHLIIPDDVHIAADLTRLTHPGSGIVQQGKTGRVLPVKFYRLEHDQIGPIAERTGWIRPGPDPLLAQALGPEYAGRWTGERAGHLAITGSSPAGALTVPPGSTERRFQQIISDLSDVDRSAATAGPAGTRKTLSQNEGPQANEVPHPARHRMRDFIRRNGARGTTPAIIARLFELEKLGVTGQTVQRWLTEDEAAGLVEQTSHGKWRATN
jgi:S-DNA-T family DNA segregation ATPase FtsK/SpoIIIE